MLLLCDPSMAYLPSPALLGRKLMNYLVGANVVFCPFPKLVLQIQIQCFAFQRMLITIQEVFPRHSMQAWVCCNIYLCCSTLVKVNPPSVKIDKEVEL